MLDVDTHPSSALAKSMDEGVPDPSNPDKLLAATYQRRRSGCCFVGGGPGSGIWMSMDGGENWEIQFNTGQPYNDCIDVRDAQHVALAAVNIFSPETEKIFVTSNGGQSWNYSFAPVVDYTHGIQYVGDDIWFATNYSEILHSSDNGESWEWAYKSSLFSSMAWSNEMNGWVVSGTSAGNDGYCVRTTDGGETWFYDDAVPGGSQVLFYDDTTGWMFFEGNSPKIWRTVDGGQTWEQHNIPSGGAWLGNIFFVNQNKGWAFGSNGALRVTTDGGVTWTSQNCNASNYIATVFFVDENEGWAAGGYGGANGFIRHTTDGGNNWEVQTPANDNHYQVSYFVNDQVGIMVAVNGKVHKTYDGGQTWEVISQLYHDYADFLIMEDESTGYLTMRNFFGGAPGEDGRGFIYKTEDGGKSWKNMGLKESRQIGKILIDPRNSDVVYVAAEGSAWGPGGDRGLYKTADGGKTWKKVLEISENTGVANHR